LPKHFGGVQRPIRFNQHLPREQDHVRLTLADNEVRLCLGSVMKPTAAVAMFAPCRIFSANGT
jgi:hypothetical protein